MLNLFVSPSSASSRKAKAWLDEYQVPYQERNILAQPLTVDEIKAILRLSENGLEDIISTRSNDYKQLEVDLNDLPTNEVYELLHQHPGMIKRPILMDNKRLQIGYNSEEIRRFLPRSVRNYEIEQAQKRAELLDA
ncbi:transcriptional regulator Spx [Limosilactobacillus equigenerosi]|nr:transcriptional regulator Spx [Limosilactobacillus equigenerosi]